MQTKKIFLILSVVITCAVSAFGQNIGPMFTTDVKIYLHKIGVAPNGAADTALRPVERIVPRREKLEHTLYALFDDELPEAEQDAGFVSPTVGMQFEGVTLKNGTATVRFSELADKTKQNMLGVMIFTDAITKTARQFSFVKRVQICAVGKTTIDADHPLPRCSSGRRR